MTKHQRKRSVCAGDDVVSSVKAERKRSVCAGDDVVSSVKAERKRSVCAGDDVVSSVKAERKRSVCAGDDVVTQQCQGGCCQYVAVLHGGNDLHRQIQLFLGMSRDE